MRQEHDASWDAPMSLAEHVTPLPELLPRRGLSEAALDSRWPRDATLRFIDLVRESARDTDFQRFHDNQLALHAEAESGLTAAAREHVSLEPVDPAGGPSLGETSLVRAVMARHTQDARGAAAAVSLLEREKESGHPRHFA